MNNIYKIELSATAKQNLSKFPKQAQKQVINKLFYFNEQLNPLEFAIKLSGQQNRYRFRIGQYRAIFSKKPNGKFIILLILKIAHRRNVYN